MSRRTRTEHMGPVRHNCRQCGQRSTDLNDAGICPCCTNQSELFDVDPDWVVPNSPRPSRRCLS